MRINLCATAAFAVVWYLLAPPTYPGANGGKETVDLQAPLYQWQHLHEFDTAKECEAERESWKTSRELAPKPVRRDPEPFDRWLFSMKCLPSDDPLLNPY